MEKRKKMLEAISYGCSYMAQLYIDCDGIQKGYTQQVDPFYAKQKFIGFIKMVESLGGSDEFDKELFGIDSQEISSYYYMNIGLGVIWKEGEYLEPIQ